MPMILIKHGDLCEHKIVKKLLPPLAIDILAAPSSQVFVEQVFSLFGDFTTGKQNRCLQSLEKKMFLKLNTRFMP